MSTSQEVREQDYPDPLQLVDAFKQAHQDMVSDAMIAHASPSEDRIFTAGEQIENCQVHMSLFKSHLFFKNADNPLFTSLALGTVIEAASELVQKVRALDPTHGDMETFKEGIQPMLEYCITGDESIELDDEIKMLIETQGQPSPEETARLTGDIYIGLLREFEDALLNSETVTVHIVEQQTIRAQKANRIANTKLYGGTLLSAFAGTYLANKLANRK